MEKAIVWIYVITNEREAFTGQPIGEWRRCFGVYDSGKAKNDAYAARLARKWARPVKWLPE